jgi:hypothetical protein
VPALERGKALLKIAAAVEAETEPIARMVALETGNAIRTQARPEVKSTADVFRYFGGVAGEIKGETIPLGEHVLCYNRREPIGVVGAIVPWNAPVVLGTLNPGTVLRRVQAERHRPGVLARRDAGQLYAAQKRHCKPSVTVHKDLHEGHDDREGHEVPLEGVRVLRDLRELRVCSRVRLLGT